MVKKPKQFLRWAGSKRKIVPQLKVFWSDQFDRYVEPFMGSASLFYAIQPPVSILSDINAELIHCFVAIRDFPSEVHKALVKFPLDKDFYYELRKSFLKKLALVDSAARFIYLNRFCFNGLYRTNNQGMFNVPYSGSKTGALPSCQDLTLASESLKNSTITCCDFERTLNSTIKGDFVYLDPPYAISNSKIFNQYGPGSFGLRDIERLSRSLKKADKRGVKFVVSYAKCEELNSFISDWSVAQINIQRNIAGFSKHRRIDSEVLINNL